MSQETPQKIKLTLKDTPPLPPRPPVSPAPLAAAPAHEDAAKAPAGVKDPLSLRDTNTSRLKRIKIDGQGQAGATVMVTPQGAGGRDKRDSTETVRLKIIREKRQGAAPAATANQTIRLRPPAEAGGVPASPVVPAADSAASPAAETIRVDDTAATVTVPTAAPAPANVVNKVSTATIKLRPGALPTPAAGPVITAEPTAAPGGAKHTIKIKMPAPASGAGAPAPGVPPDSGATIKLPSPSGDAGATMKLPEARAGKRPLTLKVPSKPGESPAAATANAAATAAAVAAHATAAQAAAGAWRPDRLVLAASVVTILALGVMLGLLVAQGLRYGL